MYVHHFPLFHSLFPCIPACSLSKSCLLLLLLLLFLLLLLIFYHTNVPPPSIHKSVDATCWVHFVFLGCIWFHSQKISFRYPIRELIQEEGYFSCSQHTYWWQFCVCLKAHQISSFFLKLSAQTHILSLNWVICFLHSIFIWVCIYPVRYIVDKQYLYLMGFLFTQLLVCLDVF